MTDTLSGYVEIFPVMTETAEVVCSYLMNKALLRFELSRSIQPETSLVLISKVTQFVQRALASQWPFHIPYLPQFTGNIEMANRLILIRFTYQNDLLNFTFLELNF